MKLKNKYSKQYIYIYISVNNMTFLNFSQLLESVFRKKKKTFSCKFLIDQKVFPVDRKVFFIKQLF